VPNLTDISKLLLLVVQLRGDLMRRKHILPSHLQFNIHNQVWHFERQRSTLLMRKQALLLTCNSLVITWHSFLNARLLLHRQILLT
jgi:hypothetical protein